MLIDSRAERERLAWAVLRLLLDDPRFDADDLDWTLVRAVAERAGVIVRVADTIVRRGEELPPRLAESAAVACTHTQRVLEIVDQLGAACRRLGIAHAFLKTAERYPDTGRDIDLLIAEPTRNGAIDAAILRSLPAAPRKRSWRNRLAGSCTYAAANGIVVDIWHGRLGLLGEHARYARSVARHRESLAIFRDLGDRAGSARSLHYAGFASWLAGVGAAALDNLMEDAATAEISRSQVWQWVKTGHFTRDADAPGLQRGVHGLIMDEVAKNGQGAGAAVLEGESDGVADTKAHP